MATTTEEAAAEETLKIIKTAPNLVNDIIEFYQLFAANPFQTMKEFPTPFILIVLAICLPFGLKWMFPVQEQKSEPLSEWIDTEDLKEKAKSLKTVNIPWECGVSQKSCSVSAQGVLRAFEFTENLTKPDVDHVLATVYKSIVEPLEDDGSIPEKPSHLIFLDTCLLDAAEKAKIAEELKSVEIIACSLTELQKIDFECSKRRNLLPKGTPIPPPTQATTGPQQVLPMNAQPNRGCIYCRKEITEKKPSQCSACKAVIYDGADCAKSDWPKHKAVCKQFKECMDHISDWKLHDFPFTFYNTEKILYNYNTVPFLTTVSKHNIGLFQRLCGCFQQVPWGGLTARILQHFQQTNPSPEEMFKFFGLDAEMFPLSKPFEDSVDKSKLDSWAAYYKARNWSMENPAALLLEIPLTIWHVLNKFYLPKLPALADGEKRKITIHLIGAEKEADLLPLFECLLPLIPKTDIAIHMIGNAISQDIPPQQRAMCIRSISAESSVFLSLTPSLYQPQHLDGTAFALPDSVPAEVLASQNFGTGPPDLIFALNAGLIMHQEWGPALQMIAASNKRFLVTERLEQFCIAAISNLPRLGAKVTFDIEPNPFRQPLYEFNKDVNLPSFSNGFIFGMGDW